MNSEAFFSYQYRRRKPSGKTNISLTSGPVFAPVYTDQLRVLDYPLARSAYTSPVTGRRGTQNITIERPTPSANRLWLWADLPIRFMQQFNQQNQCILFRIDFASLPTFRETAIYQTDLFLDLYVTADQQRYAILDEDELEEALQHNLLDATMHQQIVECCNELVARAEDKQLYAWLASFCDIPFDNNRLLTPPNWTYHHYKAGEHTIWPEGVI